MGLFILEKSRLWGDLIATSNLRGLSGEVLFTRACSDKKRGSDFKLREGIFRLDVRKKLFIMRVVKHWHRLPREVVDALSLETFKV